VSGFFAILELFLAGRRLFSGRREGSFPLREAPLFNPVTKSVKPLSEHDGVGSVHHGHVRQGTQGGYLPRYTGRHIPREGYPPYTQGVYTHLGYTHLGYTHLGYTPPGLYTTWAIHRPEYILGYTPP